MKKIVITRSLINNNRCKDSTECYKSFMMKNEYEVIQTGFNLFIIIDLL